MEELDEVEVLWPEYYACHTQADDDHKPPLPAAVASMPMSRPSRQRCAALSRPVDVPSRGPMLVIRWKHGSTEDDLEIDRGGNNKMVVPPHLLVSGRESAPVAPYASLRSGRQRQRARDLRHLRNSVLRMTGFIEG
uniref:Uncharacterized protein n=1 Tax=Avena sativa TaxID=4498 RepID=A0ACD5U160_AVESA